MSEVREILQELGYNTNNDFGSYYSCQAIYREGESNKSLVIYHKNDLCIDYVTGERFTIKDLIKKTLKLENLEETDKWLKNKNLIYIPPKTDGPKIKLDKIFDIGLLDKLIQDHFYFINRGIDIKVLKELRGGLTPFEPKSKLSGRYVFPIFNFEKQIIGFYGRDVTEKLKMKVKNVGIKDHWVFPAVFNTKDIVEQKSVILVEGIPDLLSLFSYGIRNVLCLFGVGMGLNLLNFILKLNLDKIIISTNNDKPGEDAAGKLYNKLLRYYDRKNLRIKMPPEGYNDFNNIIMSKNGPGIIKDWYHL